MDEKQQESNKNSSEQRKLKQNAQRKLDLWSKMLEGDSEALIEIMIERKMLKKEDVIDRFSDA